MATIAAQIEWCLIPVFCTLTGYSEKAVRRKIEDGVWIEGKHYRRAPDGHVTMNLQEYYKWVELAAQSYGKLA
jgi:hypothetical protein